eukprot:CAMPEP_0197311084 /NCGR_PEP_ID=MMETSP0891-20130614/9606_1 /TAXON_ID=44058 ORGANISM="Aureoumbra lagunensis, Strain CCMP1510" /NCGR_SAMPLE_ID=MMETSP0891 /ASSEMBLY_ACC=CAM_ASM_000534 /LENGTH=623 /DNA_ID=CAMNT_0042797031 /DNA_START=181 /DNA_END=2052 /DNA_ORIENTATION=+
MAGATICLFIGLAAQLALPTLFGEMVDAIADNNDDKSHAERMRALREAFLNLVGLLLLSLILTAIRAYVFNSSGEKVVARMRKNLFLAIIRQDMTWFDDQRTGDLISRLSSDTTKVQTAATESISMLLRSVAYALISLGLLFFTSWRLALVAIAVIPLVLIFCAIAVAQIKKLSAKYQTALADATHIAQEALANIRICRSFAAESYEFSVYKTKVQASLKIGLKRAAVNACFVTSLLATGFISCLAVLYYGGTLVITGSMSVGQLIAFIIYLLGIAESAGVLAGLIASVQDAIGATIKIFEIIDRIPMLKGGEVHVGERISLCNQDLVHLEPASCEFKNVKFAFASRPDVLVLNGVNFFVPAGVQCCCVGKSGGGKTTLTRLLLRFYDVSAGQILLDGQDISLLDLTRLRTQIAICAQEPTLFSGTIRHNIAYSRLALSRPFTQDEIISAAKAAYAHEFISKFPHGYDTIVGERGQKLSGGEKQRVAIARALFAQPRFLLLDEATAALDTESEAFVQAAIQSLVQGRTSLSIAHRLSTVVAADLIVVLHKGYIVGTGTHTELLQSCPTYAHLVHFQLTHAEDNDDNFLSLGPPPTTGAVPAVSVVVEKKEDDEPPSITSSNYT